MVFLINILMLIYLLICFVGHCAVEVEKGMMKKNAYLFLLYVGIPIFVLCIIVLCVLFYQSLPYIFP
jgi:hypothetical protein